MKHLYFHKPRYEVQVKTGYGWSSAGNWPARTLAEGLKSLDECAKGIGGKGDVHDHRLVRLKPVVVAFRKARRKPMFEDPREPDDGR